MLLSLALQLFWGDFAGRLCKDTPWQSEKKQEHPGRDKMNDIRDFLHPDVFRTFSTLEMIPLQLLWKNYKINFRECSYSVETFVEELRSAVDCWRGLLSQGKQGTTRLKFDWWPWGGGGVEPYHTYIVHLERRLGGLPK